MTSIGFVGTGIMGAPMAANLVRAGHEVRAFGRSERSRQRAEEAGAELVSALHDLDDAEAIITMLPDGPDVAGTLLGDGGLIGALDSGALVIDMSSIAPATAREVARAGAARDLGVVDAPVSGGEAAAVSGELSIMVGGSESDVERARPLLERLGSRVTHLGPAGSGQVAKAANQLIVACNIQAVAEAVVLIERSGIDVAVALEAIGAGLAGSAVLDRRRDAFVTGRFEPGFRAVLHAKDLGIVRGEAGALGLSLPSVAVVTELVRALVARGGGDLDHSALLALTRDLNSPLDGQSKL
jgi:2-hydroxy-3-oxopropionate reductase